MLGSRHLHRAANADAECVGVFEVVSAAPYARIVPFTYWRTGASDADDLATLVRLVAAGHVHPEIGLQADWRETPDVLAALAERRVRGNAVLTLA